MRGKVIGEEKRWEDDNGGRNRIITKKKKKKKKKKKEEERREREGRNEVKARRGKAANAKHDALALQSPNPE